MSATRFNPLSDPSAEHACVGAMLALPNLISEIAVVVRAEDFTLEPNRMVFSVLVDLDSAGRKIDSTTVPSELHLRGQLGKVGGIDFLLDLDSAAPRAHNGAEYARVVAAWGVRRRILAACEEGARLARSGECPDAEILGRVEARLLDAVDERSTKAPRPLRDVIDTSFEMLMSRRGTGGGITGVPTGLGELDKQLTGLHGGELILVAARPGVGKSVCGLGWAIHAARYAKVPSVIFSLEMPEEQLGMRALASECNVQLRRLRDGGFNDADMSKMNSGVAQFYDAPVYIDDGSSLDPLELRAKVRRLRRTEPKLGLVVIDYLQLMDGGGVGDSREQEVSHVSRSLKLLAKEMKLPVVALAQLSRKATERKGPPLLSDLRESGSLEQNADVVLFLHPEEVEEGDEARPEPSDQCLEMVIAKQRNGPIGSVPVVMRREFTRLESRNFNKEPSYARNDRPQDD